MKTGQYFYDQLPTDIQQKFKANVIKERGFMNFDMLMKFECNSMRYFIAAGFYWDDSNEGEYFWQDVSNSKYPSKFWTCVVDLVVFLAIVYMALIYMSL